MTDVITVSSFHCIASITSFIFSQLIPSAQTKVTFETLILKQIQVSHKKMCREESVLLVIKGQHLL